MQGKNDSCESHSPILPFKFSRNLNRYLLDTLYGNPLVGAVMHFNTFLTAVNASVTEFNGLFVTQKNPMFNVY